MDCCKGRATNSAIMSDGSYGEEQVGHPCGFFSVKWLLSLMFLWVFASFKMFINGPHLKQLKGHFRLFFKTLCRLSEGQQWNPAFTEWNNEANGRGWRNNVSCRRISWFQSQPQRGSENESHPKRFSLQLIFNHRPLSPPPASLQHEYIMQFFLSNTCLPFVAHLISWDNPFFHAHSYQFPPPGTFCR